MLNSTLPELKFLFNPVSQSHTFFTYASPGFLRHKPQSVLKPISASIIPSSRAPTTKQPQPYQPFRAPASPLPPKFRNLDATARIDILASRLGLWHEYAPLIPSLIQEGFTPSSIEEETGISGVEQNRLVVAAQVRESLTQSNADEDLLAAFDTSGSELLYEIRLLSTSQRVAAASYIVEKQFDAKESQDLARAMKDFPKRKGDKFWQCFDYSFPGDCLSFMYFRQSREHLGSSTERANMLERALEIAVSDKAKEALMKELERQDKVSDDTSESSAVIVKVPVIRMNFGEVAEAKSVVVLPVCQAEERTNGLMDSPWECKAEGEFGVVSADKGWQRWVALPRWQALLGLGSGAIVVAFDDRVALPWKVNKRHEGEAILVVADRSKKGEIMDDGFYLVDHNGDGDGRSGGLKVERGKSMKEHGVTEALATVLLVIRPPKDEDDQLNDDDWE